MNAGARQALASGPGLGNPVAAATQLVCVLDEIVRIVKTENDRLPVIGWTATNASLGSGMNKSLQVTYLARHGETAWTITGQHTGRTDLPLTERGEANAQRLGERLSGLTFAKVFTSPSKRARRTCELAGFGSVAYIDGDLAEWDYGEYEGRLTADILKERPDWQLFRDGCPGGESPQQVAARADRVVSGVRSIPGDVLVFSSGHFLRVLAARWIGLEPINGKSLILSTASLSALGYEHSLSDPAIQLWNDTHHVLGLNGQGVGRVHADATISQATR